MSDKKEKKVWGGDTQFAKGVSGNAAGRPRGSKNSKPRSQMRSTLAQLYPLSKQAIAIIEESLKKKTKEEMTAVDKERLATARFVVKAIESINASCLREEMTIMGIREKDERAADEVMEELEQDEVAPSRFSLNMLPTEEDLH